MWGIFQQVMFEDTEGEYRWKNTTWLGIMTHSWWGIFHGSVDESLVLLGKMWSCLGQRYLFKKLNIYRSTQGRTWKAYVPRKQPFKEKSWPCLWRKWYETLAIAAWVFAEKGCDASPRWHGLTRCMCPLGSSKTKYGHLSVLNLASGVISSMAG